MENLPVELTCQVIEYLDRADLKRLRLVSQYWAKYLGPELFKHVSIWIQQQSIEMLLQISKQPHLRQWVQSLKVGIELFPKDTNTSGWVHRLDGREGKPCCGWNMDHNEHVVNAFAAQKVLEESGAGFEMLSKAFRSLPNLKAIRIGNDADNDDYHQAPHGMETLGIWPFGYPRQPCIGREKERSSLQLKFIMNAVASSALRLEQLAVYDYQDSLDHFTIARNTALGQAVEDLTVANLAFANIQKLTWDIVVDSEDESFASSVQEGSGLRISTRKSEQLTAVLKMMPHLHTLDLGTAFELKNGNFALHLKELMDPTYLASIASLKLVFIDFDENELVDFLKIHAGTLKKITLLCCGTHTGSMKTLCERLRENMVLDEFHLSTGFDEYCGDRDWPGGDKKYELWDYPKNQDSENVIEAAVSNSLEDFVLGRTDRYPSYWVSLAREFGDATECDSDYGEENKPPGPEWYYQYGGKITPEEWAEILNPHDSWDSDTEEDFAEEWLTDDEAE